MREDSINLSPITPAGSQTGAQNGTGRSRLSRTMRNNRTLHGTNGQMPNKNSPICSTKIELKKESGVKQEFKQEHKENEYVRINPLFLRVVQTQAILFLKSISERGGSDRFRH